MLSNSDTCLTRTPKVSDLIPLVRLCHVARSVHVTACFASFLLSHSSCDQHHAKAVTSTMPKCQDRKLDDYRVGATQLLLTDRNQTHHRIDCLRLRENWGQLKIHTSPQCTIRRPCSCG